MNRLTKPIDNNFAGHFVSFNNQGIKLALLRTNHQELWR